MTSLRHSSFFAQSNHLCELESWTLPGVRSMHESVSMDLRPIRAYFYAAQKLSFIGCLASLPSCNLKLYVVQFGKQLQLYRTRRGAERCVNYVSSCLRNTFQIRGIHSAVGPGAEASVSGSKA